MFRDQFLLGLASALLCACAIQTDPLNSDRIKQKFGSYGVEILEQSPTLRRSSLFSSVGDERTCRSYAVVKFLDTAHSGIAEPHVAVLNGGSLGETFRSAGWEIQKKSIYIGDADANLLQDSILRLMRIQSPAKVALHAYQLTLKSGATSIRYATVLEAHHPDYLGKPELLEVYSPHNELNASSDEVLSLRALVLKAEH